MAVAKKSRAIAEFGDFQTPAVLAQSVCDLLSRRGIAPRTIVEPTCGVGRFLESAFRAFPNAVRTVGFDINESYVAKARSIFHDAKGGDRVVVAQSDFFGTDWGKLFSTLAEPILVIGNPPWVTNAALTVLGSGNLPHKSNFQGHAGLDAITGKANFDISEWMLLHLLTALDGRQATLAVLCKTAVARKVLCHAWKTALRVHEASIHRIDAARFFDASVDACLLICNLGTEVYECDCVVYDQLASASASGTIGCREGRLIVDVAAYERWKHLRGPSHYRWRSGVKHDCRSVMELVPEGNLFRNGDGELIDVEPDYLYPMRKSSEVAAGGNDPPRRWMLVTQRKVGEDTLAIESRAPRTWKYLLDHAEALDRRASSIYRKNPRFSVFGVGEYTFAPWKVAISGFYKKLGFAVIGPYQGRPVVLDDTSNFVPCQSLEEAELVRYLLGSEIAREFYSAYIFWDAKRPVTVDVLRELNLVALARELGQEQRLNEVLAKEQPRKTQSGQLLLFHSTTNASP